MEVWSHRCEDGAEKTLTFRKLVRLTKPEAVELLPFFQRPAVPLFTPHLSDAGNPQAVGPNVLHVNN